MTAFVPLPCPNCGGDDGPGPGPGEGCCSPAITTASWCLADSCTPVTLVIQGQCAACDGIHADPQVIGWINTDGTYTPGLPPGELVACGSCGSDDDCTRIIQLCDCGTGTPFLRHLTIDCQTSAVTDSTDTLTDGTTPYNPVGPISDDCSTCVEESPPEPPLCDPVPMCPGLVGLQDETWTIPPGTESVTVQVVCGPVTITPCHGAPAVVVNECASFSWSAPGDGCRPGELCDGFTVSVPAGSSAYVTYLVAGCEVSPS